MQYYKRKGTHTSVKLLAWNTEIKSIAKQKKKKVANCTGLNFEDSLFWMLTSRPLFILQNPLREARWQDRGHSALGKRDRAGNPVLCGGCWEILQRNLNSFLVLQLLQSGILICAKGKQKEKQPNPTTPTPPYYNKNGPTTQEQTPGDILVSEQSPDWHFILCCRSPHLSSLANKTPFQHTCQYSQTKIP